MISKQNIDNLKILYISKRYIAVVNYWEDLIIKNKSITLNIAAESDRTIIDILSFSYLNVGKYRLSRFYAKKMIEYIKYNTEIDEVYYYNIIHESLVKQQNKFKEYLFLLNYKKNNGNDNTLNTHLEIIELGIKKKFIIPFNSYFFPLFFVLSIVLKNIYISQFSNISTHLIYIAYIVVCTLWLIYSIFFTKKCELLLIKTIQLIILTSVNFFFITTSNKTPQQGVNISCNLHQ